jgi:hypothetical protein
MGSGIAPERLPAGIKGRTRSFSNEIVVGAKISDDLLTVGTIVENDTLGLFNRSAPVNVIVAAWLVISARWPAAPPPVVQGVI